MKQSDDGKLNIDSLRNAACTFEIPGAGEPERMESVDNELIMLCQNGVYRFRHADKTDPERKNPDIRNTTQCIFPFDDNFTFSQWIFRTAFTLFGKDNGLRKGITVDQILSKSTSMARDFWDIEMQVKRLIEIEDAEQSAFSQRPVENNTIHLPSAADYRPAFTNYLIKTSHIWRDLLEIIRLSFQIDKIDRGYDGLVEYFAEKYGKNDGSYKFASDCLHQLTFVRNARNALEHPDDKKSVIFRDYTLMDDCSVFLPAVKVIHPDTPHDFISASMFMERMVGNIAYIVEGMLTTCCIYNAREDGTFKYCIERLEGRADQHILERYQWTLLSINDLP